MAKNKLGAVFHQAKQAYRARDYQTAEKLIHKVLEDAEGSSTAHILLGTVFGNTGRHQEAIAEFNRAIELKPENAEAFNNLGVVYRQIGQPRDALYWLTRAI
jgi:Flp pilus assembly protein TadD